MLRSVLGALLLGALVWPAFAASLAPLAPGETFVSAENPTNSSVQAVFAEGAVLGGAPLAPAATADNAGACSALCR